MFGTVEVNATFYRLPTEKSVARWVEQTPPEFVFTIKASRYLTHVKRLSGGPGRMYEPLGPLVESGKLGPILWQLPPDFRRDDARLDEWLGELPDGRHALEVRHASWFDPDVYARLRERNVALVGAHRKGLDLPDDVITADFAFLRFHYGERGRRGNYSESEIADWAERVRALDRQQLDVFAYFNNDWEAFAPRNAVALSRSAAR